MNDWSISKNCERNNITSLGQLGARSVGTTPIETEVTATIACTRCGHDVSATALVTGDVDVIKLSGVGCPSCGLTFTLEWDGRLTFHGDEPATCGGLSVE